MKILLILLLFPYISAIGQASLNASFVCSYKCDNNFDFLKNNCRNPIRAATPLKNTTAVNVYTEFDQVIALLKRDNSYLDTLSYQFTSCDRVCNAASVVVNSIQMIYYNPTFVAHLSGNNEQLKWAVRAIIAHEIGHHILGHTLNPTTTAVERRKQELRADYFSGFVIKQFIGSTLENAQEGLKSLDPQTYRPATAAEEANDTYPLLSSRLEAVAEGFSDETGTPKRLGMFRNIDSIARQDYLLLGRSRIFRVLDKDIAYGKWQDVLGLLGQLKLIPLLPEERQQIDIFSSDLDNKIKEQLKSKITSDDVKKIKEVVEDLKKGSTEDREKAKSLEKSLMELERLRQRSQIHVDQIVQ